MITITKSRQRSAKMCLVDTDGYGVLLIYLTTLTLLTGLDNHGLDQRSGSGVVFSLVSYAVFVIVIVTFVL